MKRKTRRIIFYGLALGFLAAGPLVAAYALGYVFNFTTASFEQTGGIFIKAATPRANVFLDNVPAKETGLLTGSAFLTDVRPGIHLVRLEKQDYRSWSKTISVEPATVTEFRAILLVPYPPAAATSSPAELASAQATSTAAAAALNRKKELVAGRGRAARVIAKDIAGFTAADDGVYFVGTNGFLARYDTASGAVTTIGRPGFFLDDAAPPRFVSGQRYLGVIDSGGGLYLHDKAAGTLVPAASEAKDVSFDGTEEKLLIRRDRGIAVFWLRDHTYQPFQKQGTVTEVVSSDTPIRDAVWLYKTGAHIAWRTRDGIYLTDIDPRGGHDTAELLSGRADALWSFPGVPDALFWRIGAAVYRIEL